MKQENTADQRRRRPAAAALVTLLFSAALGFAQDEAPELVTDLTRQLTRVKALHEKDLAEGFVRDIRVLLTDQSRLAAADAKRVAGNKTTFRRGVFSPCELCEDDPDRAPLWQLKAQRVVHDQEDQTIRYYNAWMEMFGIPVIYTPYLEHPDPTVKRKSGFLSIKNKLKR